MTVHTLAAFLFAASCQAAFLDFDILPSSTLPTGTPNNVASVLTNQLNGQGIVFGRAGLSAGVAVVTVGTLDYSSPNSIVGLDAAGDIPATASGDIYFYFVVPGTSTPGVTDSVSFQIGDSCCDTDSVLIRAYSLGDALLNEQLIEGTSFQPYSLAMSGIHRIEIENVSPHNSGHALDNLFFNDPVATPEPSTFALLAAGLLLLVKNRTR